MQPPFYLFHFVIFATHPDDGDIIRALVSAGSSCHNSAASFYSCAAGFPPKSLGGREEVSLFPHIVIASKVPPLGYRLTLIAQNSHSSPPQLLIFAACLLRSYMSYVPIMPYIQLSSCAKGNTPSLISSLTGLFWSTLIPCFPKKFLISEAA